MECMCNLHAWEDHNMEGAVACASTPIWRVDDSGDAHIASAMRCADSRG